METPSRTVLDRLYAGDRAGAAEAGRAKELDVHAASALGATRRVESLIGLNPAAVDARTDDGYTPLHLAAFFGTAETVAALLRAGADPASVASNATAVTPLHSAVAQRSVEIARLLLEAGADLDAQQSGGYTALHAAARHGAVDLVRVLVEFGANALVRDDGGKSAVDFAAEAGHDDVLKLLQ